MKKEISKILAKLLKERNVNISEKEIEGKIDIPPLSELGDYAFPCFFLAAQLKENPAKIANDLKNKLEKSKNFEKIEVKGAYLNFFVKKKDLTEDTIEEILKKKDKFGKVNLGKNRKFIVEFSQPNTHKAFHVGHIRGTSIGESVARVHEFLGNKVIRANYSGDTGMHVAKWIWCYKKYHKKEKLRGDEAWIASIYVDAANRLNEDKDLRPEVEKINKELELGKNKVLMDLWKKTKKLSIDSWKKTYKELNTRFDRYYFESEVEKPGKDIANDLWKKGIAKLSDSAVIMDLRKYNLGVWVLLRKDGTVLYSAKDLALAFKKEKDFKFDEAWVLVAEEQRLHFQQLMKTLELMNFKKIKDYKFSTFGMVRLPTGKMSSRTGDNILYSDFMDELTSYAKEEILKREPKLSKKEIKERSLKVSVAAIKYSMMKQSPHKDIIFQKEDALSFEGDTGPYLLYSYARANSILRKKKRKNSFKIENLSEKEIELVKKLSEFPEIVQNAYRNLNPSLIANYSYDLAQKFNEFYHKDKVIGSENENFRLALVESFKIVLKNSLNLLGIETIERM